MKDLALGVQSSMSRGLMEVGEISLLELVITEKLLIGVIPPCKIKEVMWTKNEPHGRSGMK
jgi:hypothetical protein